MTYESSNIIYHPSAEQERKENPFITALKEMFRAEEYRVQ